MLTFIICGYMQGKGGPVRNFDHFGDNRSQQEIKMTTRLAQILSERNIATLEKEPKLSQPGRLRKEDLLYVCLCGVPPFDN